MFQAALDDRARKARGNDVLGAGGYRLVDLSRGQHGAGADQEIAPCGQPAQRLKAGGRPKGHLSDRQTTRDERVVSDRTVDSHIKKIRRKIAAVVAEREIVHSVYGVGYKYEW